jgi:Uncharacterized conserved protein
MSSYRCLLCRGGKNLCGKDYCPILLKNKAYSRVIPTIRAIEIDGSTPPGIFVGRHGYPKVSLGPLLSSQHGNTSLLNTPELWYGKSIEDIVNFRMNLIRGKYLTNVNDIEKAPRIVQEIQESALAESSLGMSAEFSKRPNTRIILDDNSQPFGPSAPIKNLEFSNFKTDQKLEKSYYDTDLKAVGSIIELYSKGCRISQIDRAFSAGTMGIKKRRKFVPTRWAITAVDDTISKDLREKIKYNETIDKFRVYGLDALDNRWQILMLPFAWRYELIEAWYPKTLWNPYSSEIAVFGDHEYFNGRKDYARLGGCYYASRLAITEHLKKESKQAGAVVMREAHPGYVLPVGVWNVREHVRRALKTEPFRFDDLSSALGFVSQHFAIPIKRWIRESAIVKDLLYQRRLEDFGGL